MHTSIGVSSRLVQITSDIELSELAAQMFHMPNQLVQSSSENDIHAQPVRERITARTIVWSRHHPGARDKGLVDFHVDGAALMLQAGIAGAEVVGGEAHADGAQGVETGDQADCRMRLIGQFDPPEARRAGPYRPHPLYLVVERWPNLGLADNTDGEIGWAMPSLPLVHLATGPRPAPTRLFPRHQAERLSASGRNWPGGNRPLPRMPPAHQRFRASDPVIAQIDQRLVRRSPGCPRAAARANRPPSIRRAANSS